MEGDQRAKARSYSFSGTKQSRTSPLEIVILDGSPKPIRKRLPVSQPHKDKNLNPVSFSSSSNTELESPALNDHGYGTLTPSRFMLPTQRALYEEIRKPDGTIHIYDVEKPSRVHKSIQKSKSSTDVKPPIPPPRHKFLKNPHDINKCNPATTAKRKLSAPMSVKSNFYTDSNEKTNKPSSSSSSSSSSASSLSKDDVSIPQVAITKPPQSKPSSVPSTNAITDHTSKQENVAYLRTLSLDSMLRLLDNMNLGQYREKFKDERIDGDLMIHLDKADLLELGVTRSIHQTRLLKLVDGTLSAKKFQDTS